MPLTKSSSLVLYNLGRSRTSGFAPWLPYEQAVYDTSEMVSFSHDMSKLGQGDQGGAFLLKKSEHVIMPIKIKANTFEGLTWPTTCTGVGWSYPTMGVQPSDNQINALGTTAIAQLTPTTPVANVSTALGEFASEGALPALSGMSTWRNRTAVARSAGDEYLNVQFGWLPLVSDLRDLAYAIKHHHKILSDYRAGSDKKTRARLVMADTLGSQSYVGSGFLSNSYSGGGTGTAMRQVKTKTWFAGAFRYHLPLGEGQWEKLDLWHSYAQKLLGVDINPEMVWNISPWSWAADWFGNVGDVMHNISALGTDGLVLQYGYMMSSLEEEVSMTARYADGTASRISRTKNLLRKPATPYGFGFDMHSLSARQTAILVALGLSRT